MSNIKSKSLASNWSENVIDCWRLQKAKVDGLDVWEVGGKLKLEAHESSERHLLENDGDSNTTIFKSDRYDNLGVGL